MLLNLLHLIIVDYDFIRKYIEANDIGANYTRV